MNIDLPYCGFSQCRDYFDGNCLAKGAKYTGCSYQLLIEKQIPMVTEWSIDYKNYRCPVCNDVLFFKSNHYCGNCGQKLNRKYEKAE
jgi:rRNA maturation endonuclease Nob1